MIPYLPGCLESIYCQELSDANPKSTKYKLSKMSTVGSIPVSRIAVIGVGEVGGAAAFALILSTIASELLLVDIDTRLRDGQVRDLSDVAYSLNSITRVRAATHAEAGQCDIVVITAGSKCVMGKRLQFNCQSSTGMTNSINLRSC